MSYDFNAIEARWQAYWAENGTFKAENNSDKPKYYVLDMFPYPSGAGLHVGHPLGYIASDIYARYKRHKGFNVLHPQGYDSFGLPAEQYAIQTGQHPSRTTYINIEGCFDDEGKIRPEFIDEKGDIKKEAYNSEGNIIAGYRKQMDKIGFSFDWSREVRTSDPTFYKWTQWIFTELFNSWYDNDADKARSISELEQLFSETGNANINAVCDEDIAQFTAADWNGYSSKEKQEVLLKYRLTYLAETEVNWCPQLGTVLANDEIVNGVSERGGYPVIRKKMTQWSMRISAYAQRLIDGLNTIDWPQPLKDSQTNWIGRSEGASVIFNVKDHDEVIDVFTTRPDTIFGVSFMTLAPEHELVSKITIPEQKEAINTYIEATAKRSERDRMADVKTISGVFTGAYAEHPFTKEPVPIWIGDYVLAGYGTGAVMAVPCGDQRDYDFAKHFGIDIPNIFEGIDISEEAFADKDNTIIANSDFLNGLKYKKAVKTAIYELEKLGQGKGKINYRLRDAVFSRQRYWGEPFPVYYVDGMPQMIDLKHLPIELPEVEKYLPTETGEPPLGRADVWAWDTTKNEVVSNDLIDHATVFPLELNTMPGWAGSSYYFNRYMDPNNDDEVFSQDAIKYWKDVDLYIGGSEHATGHLLYARFWQKFLFDKGIVPVNEFAKKLINQGMILGTSAIVYEAVLEDKNIPNIYISAKLFHQDNTENPKHWNEFYEFLRNYGLSDEVIKEVRYSETEIHIDISILKGQEEIDIEKLKEWRREFKNAKFFFEDDGKFLASREVEKMSKSKYNVLNPDGICDQYGADSLRLYEMFLGPLEQAKPWNTAGITGVHSFLKKLWKLYHNGDVFGVADTEPSTDNLKTLHKTIKKVEEDIENFSFNTSVSTFMIAVNELKDQQCNARGILEPLLILVSPYAPHIAEELWSKLGHETSIATAAFPIFDEKHLIESTKQYPISFNGKMRFMMELPLDMSKEDIETAVMAHEKTQQQLAGREPKKVIVVPGKIVNVVG
ncbi:class I tRNA ligase family protein [uncultured Aquimarina sp.]|uniref:leucine--tRNA ligase n=1 Tax=uncultured Aquimarina sp. TaxID=575652 RepID=UPI00262E139C|nr:class I tRNA ligase family protein [uncultured Aquimarina sp.]